jgi:CBS domain-containing protein
VNAVVKDVMTTQVRWVRRNTPFAEIAVMLHQYRVSAFPVLNDTDQVIGVVSESDLLAKMALAGGEDGMPGMITGILQQEQTEKARAVTAADLMTSPAATVSPDDTAEHAAQLMYLRRVKRLPVTDEYGNLAGIVSRADVLTVYGRPDGEISEEIRRDILLAESPGHPGAFDVRVTDGMVTLAGSPRTCAQGHDIARRARHVQGVVAVRDRLDYPPAGPDPSDIPASYRSRQPAPDPAPRVG